MIAQAHPGRDLFRFLIYCGLRKFVQRHICGFFFLEGCVQERDSFVEAQLSPGPQRAVARDLVVLDRLRRCQQTGRAGDPAYSSMMSAPSTVTPTIAAQDLPCGFS